MSQIRNAEHGILGEDKLRLTHNEDHWQFLPQVWDEAHLLAHSLLRRFNFSLYSRDASGIELCSSITRMTGNPRRSGWIQHQSHLSLLARLRSWLARGATVWVSGSRAIRSAKGLRFDPTKVLLDPYGRGVAVPRNYSREAARQEGDNAATAMKSVVVDTTLYDWEGDTHSDGHLRRRLSTKCT
jgi:glycogen operon protein